MILKNQINDFRKLRNQNDEIIKRHKLLIETLEVQIRHNLSAEEISQQQAMYLYKKSGKTLDVFHGAEGSVRNAAKKWTMPIREWNLALNQFAILF